MPSTVLIVEDSEGMAAPLEIALASLNQLNVKVLTNAQDALQVLSNGGNDVVALITDLHLPNMDGFELIEWVRHDQHYSKLPILVVSGDTQPDTPARLLRLGANAYFSKPYSPAEIRSALEGLINVHQLARSGH
jgi:two-component system chemotaxis response regulator CheY